MPGRAGVQPKTEEVPCDRLTIQLILRVDIYSYSYKIQVIQPLNEDDLEAKRLFCERFLTITDEN